MASFKQMQWNDYRIHLMPARKDPRALLSSLLPYFWDTEIVFDMEVSPQKRKRTDEVLKYQWELRDLDENILKRGYGDVDIPHTPLFGKKWIRKERAIALGNLHPHRFYKINITFSDLIQTSELLLASTLSVKDRDEMYMQLFILLIGIGFAFILLLFEIGGR
jgi:hypothetical protein